MKFTIGRLAQRSSAISSSISGKLLSGISAALLCAFLAGCAHESKTHGDFEGPVGLQLYSMRDQLNRDVPATLAEVRSWGVKFVELAGTYNMKPTDFKAQLDEHGLDAVSGHFGFERFRDDPEGVAREAASLGLVYVGCAWIPHEGGFDEKTCRDAAAVFNHAGQVLARHHMIFFYHTHGYEFQHFGDGTLFDLLMSQTDPTFVHFEMDIFWIVHAGQNPVDLLQKFPGRFELMHLKDMRSTTPTGLLTGGTDVKNDAALGTGKILLPSILRAAKAAGVKWYFIEDESPSSETQIPQSLQYLQMVRF
jgi:sugar phosphate isomerase/epimerase